MNATIPQIDVSPVLGDEDTCAEHLEQVWLRLGEDSHYPATTDDVRRLLHGAMFFDIDVPTLAKWGGNGTVQGVEFSGGKLAWSAFSICHAAVHCANWRRFRLCEMHAPKMTAAELLQAQAEAVGETAFTDADQVCSRDLVSQLAVTQDANLRNVLAVALLSKLKALGVSDK